ncbi:MAG: hypothetical protein P4L85_15340 [Paludisphaera borealis]|uniref:hypothetical protein n=1 Tax=Paludisphaera borealis TaxID=1387353 RepID=UPI002840E034|nr:hypothetical protein [Paludisphaera borealis]MDR3620725.1 hypothetical protein [Paludisphaera borealis]
MNCRDFDQVWNQLLDVRRRDAGDRQAVDAARVARERSLREHADACPSCQVRHRQFETLRQALEAWTARPDASPTPSPGLTERIIKAAAQPELIVPVAGRSWFVRPRFAAFALASAAAALLVTVGPRLRPEPPRPSSAPVPADGRRFGRGLLDGAVNDATAASWQLARLASEPAARLGKEMIDASFEPGDGSFQKAGFPSSSDLPSLDPESFSPVLLNQMGDLLAAGVRPLSTSARQAFGFLLTPTSEKPERPVVRPTAKGA